MTHGYFIGMGGFHLFEGSTPLYPLGRQFIVSLTHARNIKLPTETEIQDKSKTNWLTHGFVFIQTLWFVVNCLARAASSLPITKLEVATIAYISVYVWIYMTLWERPHYVDRPIPLQKAVVGTLDRRRNLRTEVDHPLYKPFLHFVESRDELVELSDVKKVPITYSGNPDVLADGYISNAIVPVFLSVVISGVLHCIPWSSNALSFSEMVLWRLFSLGFFGLILGPLAGLIVMILPTAIKYRGDDHDESAESFPFLFHLLLLPAFALFAVARIALLVLALIDLREQPRGAYKVYWTTLFPHI